MIANVGGARELATLPNGDLLVGTSGKTIYRIPNADAPGVVPSPQAFATLSEGPAEGIAFAPNGTIYAATNTTIWKIPYSAGATSGTATAIARVRQGAVAPNSDGDVHTSTSVAASTTTLYAGIGSSCNACTEVDATRATVQAMALDGTAMHTIATRDRNPIALTINPQSQALWAGGAGQDELPYSHPYEFLDAITAHPAPADYGWPNCYENHQIKAGTNADCSTQVVPQIEFPAYSTLIGAVFYPTTQSGPYTFPASYRGGMFVTMHGSWHTVQGSSTVHYSQPHVAFVAMSGDVPAQAVNWSDPTQQWSQVLTGFEDATGARIGRPTGIAVGNLGSLFVADDQSGNIYRIRPAGTTPQAGLRRR